MDIGSIIGRVAGPALGGISPNPAASSPSDQFSAIADAFGMGFLGDVVGATSSQSAAGSFSLGKVDFGSLAGRGMQAALGAALGPLGGIAASFLGDALSGTSKGKGLSGIGEGLSKGLGSLGKGISDAIGAVADALGGKSKSGKAGKAGKDSASSKGDSRGKGASGPGNAGGGKGTGGKGDAGGGKGGSGGGGGKK